MSIPLDHEESIIARTKGIIINDDDETFNFTNKLPRGYLSVSQINLYKRCGQMYKFKYVDGRTTKISQSMIQGSGVHYAAEQLHLAMIENRFQPDMSMEKMEAIYSDFHDEKSPEIEVFEEGYNSGKVKDEGIRLTREYHEGAQGKRTDENNIPMSVIEPVAAERRLDVVVRPENSDPVPMVSIIDLEQPYSVVDLKTKKRKPSIADAENSIQLSLYAHITGKPDVALHSIVRPSKRKPQRYIRHHTVRTRSEVAHALDIVGEVATDIAAGRFRKAEPDSWICSPKCCDFWHLCRGRKR